MLRRTLLCLGCLLLVLPRAFAERPPESQDDATHVVVGEVEAVYVLEDRSNRNYVVKIVVEKLERGTGFEEGDAFFAECFQRRRDAPRIPAAYGHRAVPQAGQRIRAFVIRGGPRSEGIYPDWFQVLK